MSDVDLEYVEPVSVTDAVVDDDFWTPRIETVRERTLEFVYERLVESGRIENFRIAAGRAEGEFRGRFYNDSDVYKWLEAACYVLATDADARLQDRVDELVDLIEATQRPDGYLNTYFQLVEPDRKWTNLHLMHELYCAGHLIEAAVAHHTTTGETTLLDVARRFADHVDDRFGSEDDEGVSGHEEIELALVKLYRVTDDRRYLDLARRFLDRRGTPDSRFGEEVRNPEGRAGDPFEHATGEDGEYDGTYFQDHTPVRDQETVEGHAVRATYLYTGMADVVLETGDEELFAALERLWTNMTTRRMYVTGAIGSSHVGERFTEDYDLPTAVSYAETCAALGSVLWNGRLFRLTGEARFPELQSRTLYNALLAGLSLDGTRFFYSNPHEMGPDGHPLRDEDPNRFARQRQGWFQTACCPTNVPRLLTSLVRHVYATGDSSVYVAHHVGSEATVDVAGTTVTVDQETAFPWEARTTLTVTPEDPATFELALRVPETCSDPTVTVEGEPVEATPGTFARIEREWEAGDEVSFDATFPVRFLRGNPSVRSTAGAVALRRGPIVYCLEGQDVSRPLHHVRLQPDGPVSVDHRPDLLDGLTTVETTASVPDRSSWSDGDLYRPDPAVDRETTRVRAIPYYAWGHRGDDEMRVWVDAVE